MNWLRWVVIILALTEAGWMTFDGSRALLIGDYVTPQTGERAGQLGPWSRLVSAVGIEPRSTLMKTFFVVYGVLWLAVILFYLLDYPWAWWAMLLAAIGALWYLPVGTITSLIISILLLVLGSARRG